MFALIYFMKRFSFGGKFYHKEEKSKGNQKISKKKIFFKKFKKF